MHQDPTERVMAVAAFLVFAAVDVLREADKLGVSTLIGKLRRVLQQQYRATGRFKAWHASPRSGRSKYRLRAPACWQRTDTPPWCWPNPGTRVECFLRSRLPSESKARETACQDAHP